jgi:hypothetical protein
MGNHVLGLAAAAALPAAMLLLGCRAASVPAAPADPAAAVAAGAPEGAHPRLFLTAEVRERVKRKAAAHDPDWVNVLKQADRLAASPVAPYDRNEAPRDAISYPYQGAGWLDAILPLGVAYNVTGEKAYARKIAEILRVANGTAAAGNLEPITNDAGFPSRTAALGLALGFDWIYGELTPAERAATVSTLNRWFDWNAAHGYEHDGHACGNYFGGHMLGFGAAGYATLGDNDRARAIIDYERHRYDSVILPAFKGGEFAGGFPIEGYVYGTNHYHRLLQFAVMASAASGGDSAHARDAGAAIARNLIHAIKPNHWQVPEEAAYPGETTGILALGLPLFLSDLLAGTPIGANLQQLLGDLGKPPEGIALDRPSFDSLLYWDAGRPAADPAATEPLYFHSRGDEHLFMRSSWGRDAVWASFAGALAQLSAHQARAAGHIAIQRGNDALLIFAGQWKGDGGLTGRPQQFETTSGYANTLFVDDNGEYLYKDARYLGGQGPFSDNHPFPSYQSADLTWAKLDATGAYEPQRGSGDPAKRSVQAFVRNFVYLRPDLFVVFDRVRMLKPGYVKELRFHLATKTAPAVSGNLATSIVGSSALHVRVLAPKGAAITAAWNTVGDDKVNARLAITSAGPGKDLDALDVITADDKGAAPPEAALVAVEHELMTGAVIRARGSAPADRDQVVLFATSPTASLPSAAVVSYRADAARPSRHHLFDLEAQHQFYVRVDRATGAARLTVGQQGPAGVAVTSNDAGVLQFELAGGEIHPLQ